MCGLVITTGRNIQRAMDRLDHRGIRSKVIATERGSVGHVRLPIVGLGEEYDQPIQRGRWTIAFVGEILNFRDFRPSAKSDIELVADTWITEGARGFRKFDGFWTVAALDSGTGAIHILTDYLAQKPAYYRTDGAISVASEPDAIVALSPVCPDPIYFSAVMKWGYCPETWRTPYLEVRKTLPGEHVVLQPSGYERRDITDPIKIRRQSDHTELRREIEAAVGRRVTSSDVPLAALLSGGLDSSIVYCLAKRYGDVQPYHVENGTDERAAAMTVVNHSGGVLKELEYRETSLDLSLRFMQEPIDLGSLVPQTALSEAIGRSGGERVCLTGDGADELFGGYGRAEHYDSQGSDVWHELVAWHLPRLDRVMMRNCIEVRSPFLARSVVEIALGLPREQRTGKKILRDLFRDILPPGIADRPKKPLRTPEVTEDRQKRSIQLCDMFRRMKWENDKVGKNA